MLLAGQHREAVADGRASRSGDLRRREAPGARPDHERLAAEPQRRRARRSPTRAAGGPSATRAGGQRVAVEVQALVDDARGRSARAAATSMSMPQPAVEDRRALPAHDEAREAGLLRPPHVALHDAALVARVAPEQREVDLGAVPRRGVEPDVVVGEHGRRARQRRGPGRRRGARRGGEQRDRRRAPPRPTGPAWRLPMDELPLGGAPRRDRRRAAAQDAGGRPRARRARTSSPPPTTTTSRRLTTCRSTSCERDSDTGRAKERPDPSTLTSYSPRARPGQQDVPGRVERAALRVPVGEAHDDRPARRGGRRARRGRRPGPRRTGRGPRPAGVRAGLKRCWLRWTTFAPWAAHLLDRVRERARGATRRAA